MSNTQFRVCENALFPTNYGLKFRKYISLFATNLKEPNYYYYHYYNYLETSLHHLFILIDVQRKYIFNEVMVIKDDFKI